MKVKVEIDVTPKEYFNHLCNVMIKDIKKKFRTKAIEQNAIRNIELTNIYIKNNKK